jgi:hypothetical protein
MKNSKIISTKGNAKATKKSAKVRSLKDRALEVTIAVQEKL